MNERKIVVVDIMPPKMIGALLFTFTTSYLAEAYT